MLNQLRTTVLIVVMTIAYAPRLFAQMADAGVIVLSNRTGELVRTEILSTKSSIPISLEPGGIGRSSLA